VEVAVTDASGTLERLALLLADALSPLQQDLAAGNVGSLIRQLGLELPDDFTDPAALTSVAQALATSAGALPARATALVTAIENENVGQILSEGLATLQAVDAVVTAA
jgi:hypothetical protein